MMMIGLSDLKKDNTWFTLKSCSCAQKNFQEAFQAQYRMANPFCGK